MVNRFVPIVTSLLLFGLFAIAFITGGIMFGVQNNSHPNIGDDPSINAFYQSINSTLDSGSSQVTSDNGAFTNSSVTTSSSLPFINSIGGIWKTLKSAPIAIYNLTIGLLITNLFGSNNGFIIWATLGSILTMIIISAVVLWVTRGEGG